MTHETITDLDMKILSHFRRDTLCGQCGGPVEKNRIHTCWKCDTTTHVRTQLDWIDTASMNLAIKMGIKRPPPPARQLSPPDSESDKSGSTTKEKTSRVKRAGKKQVTKRKSRKKTKLMGQ